MARPRQYKLALHARLAAMTHLVTSLNPAVRTAPTFQAGGKMAAFSSSCDLSTRRNHAKRRVMLSSWPASEAAPKMRR